MMKSKEIRALWPQWIATLLVTLVLTQCGLVGGWSSPNLAKLTAEDSVLPLTLDEASWVASIMNLGRVFGAIAGGAAAYAFGSKMSILLTCTPMALCWAIKAFTNTVVGLYVARVLGGFGLGMAFSCFPIYIGEIADPSIRGCLVSIVVSGTSLGNLLAAAIGAYCDLQTSSISYLVPCILTIVLLAWLPESPHHLIRRNNLEKAKASIAWYDRNCDVEVAFSSLQRFVEVANSQSFWEKIKEFKRPEMIKATFIILTLFMYMQMSGLNTIAFYMEMILIDAQSNIIKPSITVIIMSLFAFFAAGISMYLIDVFGRRILLIISCVGVGVSFIILEIHFILLDSGYDSMKLESLPLLSFLIFQVNAYSGIMTVPSTVLSEIFPPAIKCIAACLAGVTAAIFAFICSKTFQPLLDVLGQKYVYWIYVAIILSAVPFVVFCMPETKGKSLQQIQDDMTRKKIDK